MSSKKALYEIAKVHNIKIIFLPPYSPELNPIEYFWHWLKKNDSRYVEKMLKPKCHNFYRFSNVVAITVNFYFLC
ncbi:MAG: transposase [Synergistaceae bacterium]|nr:transposase [Synergistaceae bacterium]